MTPFEQAHAQWEAWMKDDGAIAGTVARLHIDRARWQQIEEMISSDRAIPHAWDTIGWFFYHYSVDAAIRVRRLADTDHRSASVGRLLCEVEEHASALTRDWYLRTYRHRLSNEELWEYAHADSASEWFDEFCDAPGAATVSPAVVQRDQVQLKTGVQAVRYFADKRIAHHNPRHEPELTYGEICGAVDVIDALFHRYVRLIRMVDPADPTDATNWGASFSVAWRPDS